ncbi:pentapeptide repeat-containing protein [Streptomyces mirabilis]|uniref:pentapeptide repeat-containing protein n=1 Tax=Streptomyces mirabilis TaxID=68239 RepID=UPI0033F9B8DF
MAETYRKATFRGTVSFDGAVFSGGTVSFRQAVFQGRRVVRNPDLIWSELLLPARGGSTGYSGRSVRGHGRGRI